MSKRGNEREIQKESTYKLGGERKISRTHRAGKKGGGGMSGTQLNKSRSSQAQRKYSRDNSNEKKERETKNRSIRRILIHILLFSSSLRLILATTQSLQDHVPYWKNEYISWRTVLKLRNRNKGWTEGGWGVANGERRDG